MRTPIFILRGLILFRKSWEDLSGKLGDKYDIEKGLGEMSDESLRRARAWHDTLFGVPFARDNSQAVRWLFAFFVVV